MERKYKRYGLKIPAIVRTAIGLAEELGFPLLPAGRPVGYKGPASACIPEMGKLLSVLAAGYPNGKIAEYGTGVGIGTAWLVHGLAPDAQLFSVEIDESLVSRAKELFTDHSNVEIRCGDCYQDFKDEAPFDLLFMDADGLRQYLVPENWDRVTELVKVGSKIVFDDLVPLELWPPEWAEIVDAKREFAFHNARVIGTEVRTTATQVAIIATRVK